MACSKYRVISIKTLGQDAVGVFSNAKFETFSSIKNNYDVKNVTDKISKNLYNLFPI